MCYVKNNKLVLGMKLDANNLKIDAEYMKLRTLSRLYHEYNSIKIVISDLDLTISLCEKAIADPTICVSSQDYNENMEIKKESEYKKMQLMQNVKRLLRFLGLPESTNVADLNIDIADVEDRLSKLAKQARTPICPSQSKKIIKKYTEHFKLEPGFKALLLEINESQTLQKLAQEEVDRCEAILSDLDLPYNEIPEYRADLNDAKAKLVYHTNLVTELDKKKDAALQEIAYPKPPFLACPRCGKSRQIDFARQKQR